MECSVIFQHIHLQCLLIRWGSLLNILFHTFIIPLWGKCWNNLSPRHLEMQSGYQPQMLCYAVEYWTFPLTQWLPRTCQPPVFSCPTSSSQLCYLPFYSVQLDLSVSTNKQEYAWLVFWILSDVITPFRSIQAVTVIGVGLLLFMPGSYYTTHQYIMLLLKHPPIIGHLG